MATRSYSLGAFLAVAVVGHTLGGPDVNRVHQRDGLISYPFTSRQKIPVDGKYKRQIGTDALAQEHGNVYTIDLTIGTPGQTVPVQIDTGSSLLWVNPTCDTTQDPAFCNAQPRLTESTTQTALGKSDAQYNYVSDYVSIGSAKLSQQVFGIANASFGAEVGVLGVGPSRDGWDVGYPSVIDSLAKQGLTNSRAFSVSLKGFDNTDGSIIFGGIDTGKYEGSFTKLSILPASQSPDGTTRFWVSLDSISITQADGTSVSAFSSSESGKAQAAALDTGNDVIALPSSISQKFAAGFPSAKYDSTAYQYTVDCNDPGQGQTVDFAFGEAVIKVPFAEFIARNPTDSSLCTLGILDQGDVNFVDLGQPFFRAVFAVFDWDNQNVHLAQAADCGSNMVSIGTGTDAVPSLTGDCGKPALTFSTSSSSAASSTSGSSATLTSTSTSSSAAPTSSTSTSSSTPTSTILATSAAPTSTSSSSSGSPASTGGLSSAATPTSGTAGSSSSGRSTGALSSTTSSSSTSQTSTGAGLPSKVDTGTISNPSTASSAPSSTPSASTPSTSSSTASGTTTYTYTYTTTRTSTITSCPVTVTDCSVGAVVFTTDVVTAITEVCPETVTSPGSVTATATATAVPQKSWTTSIATATAVTSMSTVGVAPAETECVAEMTAPATATVTASATVGSGDSTGGEQLVGTVGAGIVGSGAGASSRAGSGASGSGGGREFSAGAGAGTGATGAGTGAAVAGPATTLVWSAGSGAGTGGAAGTGAEYVGGSATPTQAVVYAGVGRVGSGKGLGWVLTAVVGGALAVVGVGL